MASKQPGLRPPRFFYKRRVNKYKEHAIGLHELVHVNYIVNGSSEFIFKRGVINRFDKKSKDPR